MGEVALDGRVLREYIDVFGDYLGNEGRLAALARALKIFVKASSSRSLEEAVKSFRCRKSNRLHAALQKTVNQLRREELAFKSIWFYMNLLSNFLRFFDVDVDSARKKIEMLKKRQNVLKEFLVYRRFRGSYSRQRVRD